MPPGTSRVTPTWPASSVASARVIPTTPNFDAQYAVASGSARRPSVEATVTILPAALLERGQRGPDDGGGAEQVDGDDLLPLGGGHVAQRAAAVRARGGHHRVDAAGAVDQRADRVFGGRGVGEVDDGGERALGRVLDGHAVDEQGAAAGGGHRGGDGAAEAGRSAGDEHGADAAGRAGDRSGGGVDGADAVGVGDRRNGASRRSRVTGVPSVGVSDRPGAVRGAGQRGRGCGAQPPHGVEHVLGLDLGEAGMPGNRAVAGAGVAARGVLVAEQHLPDAVGPPSHGRDDRGEQRHHRRADRGGQVRRARVADDDGVGAGQHRGELGKPGAAPEVERARCPGGDLRGERALVGTAGDDDARGRRAASRPAARRWCSAGQRRAVTAAPGCNTT